MNTLTITLPDELTPEQAHDLKMELAGLLYSKGLLSTGAAAALVGIGRGEFIEQIGHYGVSLVGESIENFAEEVAHARRFIRHQPANISDQNRAPQPAP